MPDLAPKGFTLITDEVAAKLAETCPNHKIIIDCLVEIPAAAQAIILASQGIGTLAAPFYARIQETPELKKIVGLYALEAHGKVKELYAIAQWFATAGAEIGIAIERFEYDETAQKTP